MFVVKGPKTANFVEFHDAILSFVVKFVEFFFAFERFKSEVYLGT